MPVITVCCRNGRECKPANSFFSLFIFFFGEANDPLTESRGFGLVRLWANSAEAGNCPGLKESVGCLGNVTAALPEANISISHPRNWPRDQGHHKRWQKESHRAMGPAEPDAELLQSPTAGGDAALPSLQTGEAACPSASNRSFTA